MNKVKSLMQKMGHVQNRIVWLNKPKMEEALSGYTSSEVHCIEAIHNIENPNVKKISDDLFMTRGAISKLTKKLIKKNAITVYQKDDNKKEIYFDLTTEGNRVYSSHLALHDQFLLRDKPFFDDITEEEFEILNRFFDKYSDYLDQVIDKEKA